MAQLLKFFQFVERTFQIAKPNLRINGRNFDEYDNDEQGALGHFPRIRLRPKELLDRYGPV